MRRNELNFYLISLVFEHHRHLKHLATPPPHFIAKHEVHCWFLNGWVRAEAFHRSRVPTQWRAVGARARPEVRGALHQLSTRVSMSAGVLLLSIPDTLPLKGNVRWRKLDFSEYMDACVVCSTESKFMSRAQCIHAYAFATGLEQLQWDAERSRSEEWTVYVSLAQR